MAFGRLRKKKQDDASDASVKQEPETETELETETGPETELETETGPETEQAPETGPEQAPGQDAVAPVDGGQAVGTQDAGGGPAATDGVASAGTAPAVPAGHVSSAEYDRTTLGPFDVSEQDTENGYIDLGALRINAAEGLQLRLEVEERSKRVIAVTLDLGGSTLQLQAFAAPRTEGLWDEIREQIGASVGSQGGTVEERPGRLGTELLAKLPAELPDGQPGFRVARFVGINGPRWFLRGVFGGPAALEQNAGAAIESLFRSVVVVRGDHPLPPRELLPLKLPKDAAAGPPAAPEPQRPDLNPLERGPEITETR